MTNNALPPLGRNEIRAARGPKETIDPKSPIAHWDEIEIAAPGYVVPTRVLLLAGSECRFTCTMCDLWRHTLDRATAPGDLVLQIQKAIKEPWSTTSRDHCQVTRTPERWIKLYNSSNFFDPYNVPTQDLSPIAELLHDYSRVIVENHPRLLFDTIPEFRDQLTGKLEIAMGLETIDPAMLRWLNKGMILDDFYRAMHQLQEWNIDARVFLLLGLPGYTFSKSLQMCLDSIALASSLGVRHCSVIPTRTTHGVLAQLSGANRIPAITALNLEEALAKMLGQFSSIVTVDLWDWDKLPGHCTVCSQVRRERLAAMCTEQRFLPTSSTSCDCPTAREGTPF